MDTILIGAHVVDFGTAVVGFFLISAVFLSHLCKRYIGLTLFLVAACLAYYFDFVISAPTKANWRDYLSVIFCCATAYVVAIFIAKNTGLVDYDVKFPDYIFSWILVNLFITTSLNKDSVAFTN
jgi:hypothetical protein